MAEGFTSGELKNVHMKFSEDKAGGDDVTFLYEVGEGVAHRSYGLNVARLAGLEGGVIEVARMKSAELEHTIRERRLGGVVKGLLMEDKNREDGIGRRSAGVDVDALVEAIEML